MSPAVNSVFQEYNKKQTTDTVSQDGFNFHSVIMNYQIVCACVCTFVHLLSIFCIPGTMLDVKWALLNKEKDMIPVFMKFPV